MKIIQLSDNIKINIEAIYSLEKHNNQNELDEWENEYQNYIEQCTKDPPLLPITDDEVWRPIFGETCDEEKMKLYGESLSVYINSMIGECPILKENYIIILNTGLKINIDKFIYDKINNYLEKYIDKEI